MTITYIDIRSINDMIHHILTTRDYITGIKEHDVLPFTYELFKHYVYVRCEWIPEAKAYLNKAELESLYTHITITDSTSGRRLPLRSDYIEYLAHETASTIEVIEELIMDLLDGVLPSVCWTIFSIPPLVDTTMTIIDDGDYRIHEWAQLQKQNRTTYGKRYTLNRLRSN